MSSVNRNSLGTHGGRQTPRARGRAEHRWLCDAWSMRQVYAQDAVVRMGPTDDPDAIGAAVTVALCGHWEHDPPCPLAPHATRAERNGGQVQVRTLFATGANLEMEVRRRIDHALTSGSQQAPTGDVQLGVPGQWSRDRPGKRTCPWTTTDQQLRHILQLSTRRLEQAGPLGIAVERS